MKKAFITTRTWPYNSNGNARMEWDQGSSNAFFFQHVCNPDFNNDTFDLDFSDLETFNDTSLGVEVVECDLIPETQDCFCHYFVEEAHEDVPTCVTNQHLDY